MLMFLLMAALILEPAFRERITFALSYLDSPTQITREINNLDQIAELSAPLSSKPRSHAPEPSTLFLLMSGMGGIIISFARRSFAQFKRGLDLSIAAVGLTITSPLLAFLGILIKLDSKGSIIYRQNRVGMNGKVFRIFKLRTMRSDAEKYTGAVWASENDSRVTRLGKILRKTHLDEIPQLFNVVKGEMSIVGPRPERPEIVRDLKTAICDYEKRLNVQPGITGLAQVRHKYDETIADVKKKIKYDIFYIKKMCWLVEMRIIAQTFVVMLTGKGAR